MVSAPLPPLRELRGHVEIVIFAAGGFNEAAWRLGIGADELRRLVYQDRSPQRMVELAERLQARGLIIPF